MNHIPISVISETLAGWAQTAGVTWLGAVLVSFVAFSLIYIVLQLRYWKLSSNGTLFRLLTQSAYSLDFSACQLSLKRSVLRGNIRKSSIHENQAKTAYLLMQSLKSSITSRPYSLNWSSHRLLIQREGS